jgi:hypothetical protein
MSRRTEIRDEAANVQDDIGWSDSTDVRATSAGLLALSRVVTDLAREVATVPQREADDPAPRVWWIELDGRRLSLVECPACYATVREDRLNLHGAKAHGVTWSPA